jgi:hypothetical protein
MHKYCPSTYYFEYRRFALIFKDNYVANQNPSLDAGILPL